MLAIRAVCLLISMAVISFPEFATACENHREIWSRETRGLRTLVYFPEKRTIGMTDVVFEGWKNERILWRVRGHTICSSGIVKCELSVPMTRGSNIGTSVTLVFDGAKIEYIVFGILAEETLIHRRYSHGQTRVAADWFVPQAEIDILEEPVIVLPSYYKLTGCQRGDELSRGTVAISADSQTVYKQSLSKLRLGMSYFEAGALLLDGDWIAVDHFRPVRRSACGNRQDICRAIVETKACRDDGSDSCVFELRSPRGGTLSIVAAGRQPETLMLESWSVSN